MSRGSRASPSRVDARVPIGVSLQVIGQVIQKPLARLRDFPGNVDFVIAISKPNRARKSRLVQPVGKRAVIRAMGKDDHVAPVGEQGHQPRNVKPGVLMFRLAFGIKRASVRGQVESFGTFPILDMGIFDHAQAAVNRARPGQIKPLARRPQPAVQHVARARDFVGKPTPIRMPAHGLGPGHADGSKNPSMSVL